MKYIVYYRKMQWEAVEVEANSKGEAIDSTNRALLKWLDSLDDSADSDYEIDKENVEISTFV